MRVAHTSEQGREVVTAIIDSVCLLEEEETSDEKTAVERIFEKASEINKRG